MKVTLCKLTDKDNLQAVDHLLELIYQESPAVFYIRPDMIERMSWAGLIEIKVGKTVSHIELTDEGHQRLQLAYLTDQSITG